MIKKIIEKYKDYQLLIENEKLQFVRIDNVTKDVLKNFKIYEIDHTEKVIYLESIDAKKYILIASGDYLELPLAVVDNFNQAAEVLNVEATHLYRAWRNAGKPSRLTYKDYILIKI